MKNIKEELIKVLGEPKNSLDEYINLVSADYSNIETDYIEVHHILPRSLFPQFKKESWNLVKLPYKIHIDAHILLAKCYPIGPFIRPLNWMLNIEEKIEYNFKGLCAIRAKEQWMILKQNKEKYNNWILKRSKYMKSVMVPGTLVYDNIIQGAKDRWTKEERLQHSNIMKDRWANDEDFRLKCCKNRGEPWSEERHLKNSLILANKRLDEEYVINLKIKMKEVNSNEDKRRASSETAIRNMKDTRFKEEVMKKIKSTKQSNIDKGIIPKTNSSKLKELWADPIWKENMLSARKQKKELYETN